MHNEGKKHKRTLALQALTKGGLGQSASDTAALLSKPGDSSAALGSSSGAQQQLRDGDAGARAAAKGLFCAVCQLAMPSPEHMQYHLA